MQIIQEPSPAHALVGDGLCLPSGAFRVLQRNYQLMPGLKWLRLLMNRIRDRYEHLVRYYGYCSNRSRGARRLAEKSRSSRVCPPSSTDPGLHNSFSTNRDSTPRYHLFYLTADGQRQYRYQAVYG